jgi:hypothetical protein
MGERGRDASTGGSARAASCSPAAGAGAAVLTLGAGSGRLSQYAPPTAAPSAATTPSVDQTPAAKEAADRGAIGVGSSTTASPSVAPQRHTATERGARRPHAGQMRLNPVVGRSVMFVGRGVAA